MKKSICALSTVLLTASAVTPFVVNTVAYADVLGNAPIQAGNAPIQAPWHTDGDNDKNADQKVDQVLTTLAAAPTTASKATDDAQKHVNGDKNVGNVVNGVTNSGNVNGVTNSGNVNGDKTSGNVSNDKDSLEKSIDAHKAQLNQLRAAIDQLHKDQKAEQAAHKALLKQGKAFVEVMEQAITSGHATTVQEGNQGIKTILTDLKKALNTQADEDNQFKSFMESGKHGDLARALQAIRTADDRVKAKTAAMQKAADELKNLVATLKSQLSTGGASASGSSSAGASTSTSSSKTSSSAGASTSTSSKTNSSSSTVNNEGNATVTAHN